MAIERESSKNRIQSTIIDFVASFNEQISSFIMGNVPDFQKFGVTQTAAIQKYESSIEKLNQESVQLETKQKEDRQKLSLKNAEDLTKIFKESMLASEENAKYFRDQVLGDLQKGNYNINVGDLSAKIAEERKQQFEEKSTLITRQAPIDINNQEAVQTFREQITSLMKDVVSAAPDEPAKAKAAKPYAEVLNSLNKALEANKFTTNEVAQNNIKAALKEKQRSQEELMLAQANAQKELSIKQEFDKKRLEIEKIMGIQKAKIDEQNFYRLKAMESLSKRIGFQGAERTAIAESGISDLQRSLNNPRNQYFKGVSQITSETQKIEAKILQQRRQIEDSNLAMEMAQAQLQLSAEIENTNALQELNNNIMRLVSADFAKEFSPEKIAEIEERISEMGPSAQNDIDLTMGTGTFARYEAYKRIQKQLQNPQSATSGINEYGKDFDFESLKEA